MSQPFAMVDAQVASFKASDKEQVSMNWLKLKQTLAEIGYAQ